MSLPAALRRAIAVLEGDRRCVDLVEELRVEADKLERRHSIRKSLFERRAALPGEKFLWADGGAEIELVVREASPGDEGRWWCVSCGVAFEHNLARDLHCQRGGKRGHGRRRLSLELGDHRARHVLAWRNFRSGFVEVP